MLHADHAQPRLPAVKGLLRAAAAAIVLLLAACSASGYAIADLAEEINRTRSDAPIVVAVGDTLRLRFANKTEWSQDVRVRTDGVAVFPVIGEVVVVGMTMGELDTRLEERYRGTEGDGGLWIDLASGAAEGAAGGGGVAAPQDVVFVVGEVITPGAIAMTGRPLTLFEAIAAAGGHLKESANLGNTILTRRLVSGAMRAWRLDCDIYDWGNQPPIWLQPRDIVFVPNTAIDEVNIWVDKYIRQMIPLPTLFPAQ